MQEEKKMRWYHDDGEQYLPSKLEAGLFLTMILFLFLSVAFSSSVKTVTIFTISDF